jgi:hypothetical protein
MFERTTRTNRLQNILNEEFGINSVTPQETANNLV